MKKEQEEGKERSREEGNKMLKRRKQGSLIKGIMRENIGRKPRLSGKRKN